MKMNKSKHFILSGLVFILIVSQVPFTGYRLQTGITAVTHPGRWAWLVMALLRGLLTGIWLWRRKVN